MTMTPEELYKLASERYFRVYDFAKGTRKSDMKYIRVGIINNPNDLIRWNYFDGEKLLSDVNFDKADIFEDGCAIVTRGHMQNVLRLDGTYVFPEWHNSIVRVAGPSDHFIVGNYLDKYGLQSKEAIFHNSEQVTDWYQRIMPVVGNPGHFIVTKQVGERWIDHKDALYDLTSDKLLSEWYDSIMPLFQIMKNVYVARIRNGGEFNLMRPDGRLMFDAWSIKDINCDTTGNCQIVDSDGVVHNYVVK